MAFFAHNLSDILFREFLIEVSGRRFLSSLFPLCCTRRRRALLSSSSREKALCTVVEFGHGLHPILVSGEFGSNIEKKPRFDSRIPVGNGCMHNGYARLRNQQHSCRCLYALDVLHRSTFESKAPGNTPESKVIVLREGRRCMELVL
jgi:hypothetical protein